MSSATAPTPRMTREEFLDWADARDARYEFDGFEPVAMTGGNVNHSLIRQNVYAALRPRLRGGPCKVLGPDAGVATVGDAVRYPDALVTCSRVDGTARIVQGVVVVFEVLSPSSGRTDGITKLREYPAVPSIRRYAVLEYASIGLTVYERAGPADPWTAYPLTDGQVLRMPEIGVEVPIAEFYEAVELASAGVQSAP